jgi:hypothetical protein
MGRDMSRWDPHVDLARLMEALAQDIVGASDEEVRRPYHPAPRCSLHESAEEIRSVIAAAMGDEPDARVIVADAVLRRERCVRQH